MRDVIIYQNHQKKKIFEEVWVTSFCFFTVDMHFHINPLPIYYLSMGRVIEQAGFPGEGIAPKIFCSLHSQRSQVLGGGTLQ